MNLEEYDWYDAFGLADVARRGPVSAAAVVAVAAGIAPLSHAADGAGSISVPPPGQGAQRAV